VRNIYGPLHNHPNKLLYDVTFARRFLYGEQMTDCEHITIRVHAVVVDCFSDPGLPRNQRCTVLHHCEVMSLKMWLE